ncbi:MAG TPA: thiamine pyrophosphate-dependent enzyme [Hyphomicrobiaceae bacterium]|jgi:phosphonopyruvate decarboxylase|nr:thiamine pyrophosphate-dependent enzyme [Hyphomicrobiaceae bacterium]
MTAKSNKIERRPFMAALLQHRGDALIVPGLGSPTWDCFAAGDAAETLYSWGGMGLAATTALGVAIAQPSRRVVCVTGDGEITMGIGSLAVIADQAPKNLGILVLDNESFGETGRQRGLSSNRLDIAATAKGMGITHTMTVTEQGKVGELADFLFKTPGPVLAVAKIALTQDPWCLPEKDGAAIAHRFRMALGLEKA